MKTTLKYPVASTVAGVRWDAVAGYVADDRRDAVVRSVPRYPVALTVAGSDSGGCAGIQADLKTFSALGVFGASAVTAITAQNTREVRSVEVLSPAMVRAQIEAVMDDIAVDALKTGMLPTAGIIEVVSGAIDRYGISRVVVDPVMVATSGARLASAHVLDAARELLYPRITLLTPNIPEAVALSGVAISSSDDIRRAAEILIGQGCPAVLIKGGHFGDSTADDVLFRADGGPVVFPAPRSASRNLHGTGCTFSSAIAACLALGVATEASGLASGTGCGVALKSPSNPLVNAIAAAKSYISDAIEAGTDAVTGGGAGPVNHFFDPKKLKIR